MIHSHKRLSNVYVLIKYVHYIVLYVFSNGSIIADFVIDVQPSFTALDNIVPDFVEWYDVTDISSNVSLDLTRLAFNGNSVKTRYCLLRCVLTEQI